MKTRNALFPGLLVALCVPMQVLAQTAPEPARASLSSIIIYTQNLKPLSSFYEKAFGFGKPATVLDNHIGYWLGDNYVGFEPPEKALRRPGALSAWFRVADIDAAYARLIELGAKPNMKPTRQSYGDIHATVYDPDGNLLGVIESAPQE